MNAPNEFHFVKPTARIDWSRLARIDVTSLRNSGDAAILEEIVGDISMGSIDDRRAEVEPKVLHAFRLLQLEMQYILFSHQALRESARDAEKVQMLHVNMTTNRAKDLLASAFDVPDGTKKGRRRGIRCEKRGLRRLRQRRASRKRCVLYYSYDASVLESKPLTMKGARNVPRAA